MVSKANYQLLKLQVNFASYLGMTPFKFDYKNKLVSSSNIKSSKIKLYAWFAIVSLSFTIRLCEVFASVSDRNSTSPIVVAFQAVLAGCHFCGVLHFAAISQKGDDFVKLANAIRNFGRLERSSK